MYYFKFNDTSIEKYIVTFNSEKIKKIRTNIINDCSEVIHREVDAKEAPSNSNRMKVRGISKIPIENSDEMLYHFSYDEYIYPNLVNLINMLLREDAKAIDGIFLSNYLDDINNISDKDKQDKLASYYQKIQDLLSFELIATISIEEPKKENNKQKRRIRKIKSC